MTQGLAEQIVSAVLNHPTLDDDASRALDEMGIDAYLTMKEKMEARVERILLDAERGLGHGC